jgi:hypothetical protein
MHSAPGRISISFDLLRKRTSPVNDAETGAEVLHRELPLFASEKAAKSCQDDRIGAPIGMVGIFQIAGMSLRAL